PYGTSAYRAVNKAIEAPPKRYRYVGKERDTESGLYYYGARYYASWLGRWVSADPAGLRGGQNAYEANRGDPINMRDLSGALPDFINKKLAVVKEVAKGALRSEKEFAKEIATTAIGASPVGQMANAV